MTDTPVRSEMRAPKGELAYLWDAALTAMKAAAYKSDNLDD
jgi:hypothetical protein